MISKYGDTASAGLGRAPRMRHLTLWINSRLLILEPKYSEWWHTISWKRVQNSLVTVLATL